MANQDAMFWNPFSSREAQAELAEDYAPEEIELLDTISLCLDKEDGKFVICILMSVFDRATSIEEMIEAECFNDEDLELYVPALKSIRDLVDRLLARYEATGK